MTPLYALAGTWLVINLLFLSIRIDEIDKRLTKLIKERDDK